MIWPSGIRRSAQDSFRPFDYLVLFLFLEEWLLCCYCCFCFALLLLLAGGGGGVGIDTFPMHFVDILLVATISLAKINHHRGLVTVKRWRRRRRKGGTFFSAKILWAPLSHNKASQKRTSSSNENEIACNWIHIRSYLYSWLASHPRDQRFGSFFRPASPLRTLEDSLGS